MSRYFINPGQNHTKKTKAESFSCSCDILKMSIWSVYMTLYFFIYIVSCDFIYVQQIINNNNALSMYLLALYIDEMYFKLKLTFVPIYPHWLVLSAQDDLGIQWNNYRDRELNPCSCETLASRSTAFTTIPNCRLLYINNATYLKSSNYARLSY